jgi:lipopolysaccharide export system protein LptA
VAKAMEMTRRGDLIRFRDNVTLFQEDVELHAGELLFENASQRMTCRSDAELKFVSENEPVELRGQAIVFNHAERKAVISGNASLTQAGNVLGGRQIELDFDPGNELESILARDNVVFSRDNLSARSGALHWPYRKKVIWFRNSAQITRKDAGTTRGQELILNLSTNEITVSSHEDRAETILRADRP